MKFPSMIRWSLPRFLIINQQGILIGYISSIETDSNNLTKSGTITPAVDFEHIEEVLVILNKKQTVEN